MKKKTFNFWKPIRHKKPLKLKPKKDLTWKEAKRRYPKLKPYGDADRDGKKNRFDCKPFDKKRHKYTRGPGGNYRWSATAPEMKKHYGELRKAGIPVEKARIIRSWRPTRIKQVIEGKRDVSVISTAHDYKKYQKEYRAKAKALEVQPDTDRDLVVDKADCEPYNPDKQGFLHMVNPKSKWSLRRYEKYKPQVQTIVNRLAKEASNKDLEAEKIRNQYYRQPEVMFQKLKKLDAESQPENVGLWDFASMPGIVGPEGIGKGTQPVHLIVEKGIVKGEAFFKRRSPNVMETKSIYILPEYRKQGLGKKVIRSMFKNPKITTKVGVSAIHAKPWHEKLGAKQTGMPDEVAAKREHIRQGYLGTIRKLLEREGRSFPDNITEEEADRIREALISDYEKKLSGKEKRFWEKSGWENTLTKEDFEKNFPEKVPSFVEQYPEKYKKLRERKPIYRTIGIEAYQDMLRQSHGGPQSGEEIKIRGRFKDETSYSKKPFGQTLGSEPHITLKVSPKNVKELYEVQYGKNGYYKGEQEVVAGEEIPLENVMAVGISKSNARRFPQDDWHQRLFFKHRGIPIKGEDGLEELEKLKRGEQRAEPEEYGREPSPEVLEKFEPEEYKK